MNANLSILLVDDEEEILLYLTNKLTERGFVTYTANSGIQALAILEQQQVTCVLSDIKMPVMDGLTLLSQVRTKSSCPSVPFIFFTSYADKKNMREALRYGAYDFVEKPSFKDLFEVLERGIRCNFTLEEAFSEYQQMLSDKSSEGETA